MKPGSVPTARIAPVIYTLIAERWPHGGGLEVLAEKIGCDQSAIASIIDQDNPGVGFDFADNLLCALGRADMWYGTLSDIYPTKFIETCESRACNKRFPEKMHAGHKQRYCSWRCFRYEWNVRAGNSSGNRKQGRCNKGHKFTPENTALNGRGGRICRTCKQERQRAFRARKRAARAA